MGPLLIYECHGLFRRDRCGDRLTPLDFVPRPLLSIDFGAIEALQHPFSRGVSNPKDQLKYWLANRP